MLRIFLVTLLVLSSLWPMTSFAQSPPVAPTSAPVAPATEEEEGARKKSPSKALLLSLGSTLASYGIAAGGVAVLIDGRTRGVNLGLLGLTGAVVCPALGHIYADGGDRVLWRAGLRLGAATVAMYGFLFLGSTFGNTSLTAPPATRGLLLGGTLTLVGLGLYDIIDAPFAVRRAALPDATPRHPALSLQFLPLVGKPYALGLTAAGSF